MGVRKVSGFCYSAKNNAVYPLIDRSAFEFYGNWPDDAVLLDEKTWQRYFLAPPPEGYEVAAGPDGLPCFTEIPPPTKEDRVRQAKVARDAQLEEVTLKTQNWSTQLSLGMLSAENTEKLKAWMYYAQELESLVITQDTIDTLRFPVSPDEKNGQEME